MSEKEKLKRAFSILERAFYILSIKVASGCTIDITNHNPIRTVEKESIASNIRAACEREAEKELSDSYYGSVFGVDNNPL